MLYYKSMRKIKLSEQPTLKLYVLSDLHFRGVQDLKKLRKLVAQARAEKPDAIILAGDIVDDLSVVDKAKGALKKILEEFAEVAPVYLGFGNHDLTEFEKIDGWRYQISKPEKFQQFVQFLAEIPGVTPLNNKSVKIKDKVIYGLTLPPEYYGVNVYRKVLTEDKTVLEKELKKAPPADLMLIHSPVYVKNPQTLTLSGHMHDGALPLGLGRILPGTRGIISPEKHLFPKNARKGEGNLIILGPVTVFPGTLKWLNFLFTEESVIIEL